MPINVGAQMKDTLDDRNYQAFLLRCWRESPPVAGTESTWRFSLINHDGFPIKKGFACLEDLFEYLQAELSKWDAVAIKE